MPLVRSACSRTLRVVAFAASLTAVAVLQAPVAAAQTTNTSAASFRAEADSFSGRYFSTLERVQSLDADITRNQQAVADLAERAKKARDDTREPAR